MARSVEEIEEEIQEVESEIVEMKADDPGNTAGLEELETIRTNLIEEKTKATA